MSDPQKAGASASDSVKKGQLPDDGFGNDFLISWKSGNDNEDMLNFPNGSIPTGKKNTFSLDKLDVDFSFDGGFEKFSSFKVDMSDFDFSSPPKTGHIPKERKQKQAEKEKSDQTSEDFMFNFNFNEFEGFDLSPSLPKKGKEAPDAKTLCPPTYDEAVEKKLTIGIRSPENENDELLNLGSLPTSHSRSANIITGVSETMLEARKSASLHEGSLDASHIVAASTVGSKTNALTGKEISEETEGLNKDATVKFTTELEDREAVKDFPPESVYDSTQLTDPSSDSEACAVPSGCKEDTVIREMSLVAPDADAQGPKVLKHMQIGDEADMLVLNRTNIRLESEPSCTMHGELADAANGNERSSRSSPYFLQKLGPTQFCADGQKIVIKQSEEMISSLLSKKKNKKDGSSIGHAFSLISGATLDRKQPLTIPKGTRDHAGAAAILPDAKESSSTPTNKHGRILLNTRMVTNCKGISERDGKASVPETEKTRVISSLKLSRALTANDSSISDKEGKNSMLETEKRPTAISSVRLRTLETNGDSSTSRVQKLLKLFSPSMDKKVDLRTSLRETKFNLSDMAVLSSPSLKRKLDQGPTMRELTKSPLKHVMESPLLESRKRCKKDQIIEQKEVFDTKNAECSPNPVTHDLMSVSSATLGSTTIGLEASSLVDDNSVVKKAEAYAKDLEDISDKLQKMNEETQEVLVRAAVNNNFLLLLNHSLLDVKIHALRSLACSMMAKNYEG